MSCGDKIRFRVKENQNKKRQKKNFCFCWRKIAIVCALTQAHSTEAANCIWIHIVCVVLPFNFNSTWANVCLKYDVRELCLNCDKTHQSRKTQNSQRYLWKISLVLWGEWVRIKEINFQWNWISIDLWTVVA